MDAAGFDRLGDLGDGGRYSSAGRELPGMQFGDGIEDRQQEILQGAILDPEVQRGPKLVRAFPDQDAPDLFSRALKGVEVLRDGLQLVFLRAAIPAHLAGSQSRRREAR